MGRLVSTFRQLTVDFTIRLHHQLRMVTVAFSLVSYQMALIFGEKFAFAVLFFTFLFSGCITTIEVLKSVIPFGLADCIGLTGLPVSFKKQERPLPSGLERFFGASTMPYHLTNHNNKHRYSGILVGTLA